jgi:hypothetical protein
MVPIEAPDRGIDSANVPIGAAGRKTQGSAISFAILEARRYNRCWRRSRVLTLQPWGAGAQERRIYG